MGLIQRTKAFQIISSREKENDMAEGTPKCKVHPTVDAVIRADGRSMGRCKECMMERGKKMREGRAAGGTGGGKKA